MSVAASHQRAVLQNCMGCLSIDVKARLPTEPFKEPDPQSIIHGGILQRFLTLENHGIDRKF